MFFQNLIANMCFSGSCVRLYTLSGVYAGIDFGKQEWTQDQLTTADTALHLTLAAHCSTCIKADDTASESISGHTAQAALRQRKAHIVFPQTSTLEASFGQNRLDLTTQGKDFVAKLRCQSFDIRQGLFHHSHFLSIGHSLVGHSFLVAKSSYRYP